MSGMTRRSLLGAGAAVVASAVTSPAVIGQARARVVVIGGGPGGATVAKYVARDSAGAINVSLIEPSASFVTCFHSNLYLGGFKTFEQITHSYEALTKNYGVNHVRQTAAFIDRDEKRVRTADNTILSYDRLVVAPGIDLKYDSVPG